MRNIITTLFRFLPSVNVLLFLVDLCNADEGKIATFNGNYDIVNNDFDDAGMPINSSPVQFIDESEDNAEQYFDENGFLQEDLDENFDVDKPDYENPDFSLFENPDVVEEMEEALGYTSESTDTENISGIGQMIESLQQKDDYIEPKETPAVFVTYAPTPAKSSESTDTENISDIGQMIESLQQKDDYIEPKEIPAVFVTNAPTPAKSSLKNPYGIDSDYYSNLTSNLEGISNAEVTTPSPTESSMLLSHTSSISEDTLNADSGIDSFSSPSPGDELSEYNSTEDTQYIEVPTPTSTLTGYTPTPTANDPSSLLLPGDEISESNTTEDTQYIETPTLTSTPIEYTPTPTANDPYSFSTPIEYTPTPITNDPYSLFLPGDELSESNTTEDTLNMETATLSSTPSSTPSLTPTYTFLPSPENELSEFNGIDNTVDPFDVFGIDTATPTPLPSEYPSSLNALPSATPSFSLSGIPTSLPSTTPILTTDIPTNALLDNTIIGITSASPSASLTSPPVALPATEPPIQAHHVDDATWFNDESDQPSEVVTVKPAAEVDFYDMTLFEKVVYEVDLHQSALIAGAVVCISFFLMAFTAKQVRDNPNGIWAG